MAVCCNTDSHINYSAYAYKSKGEVIIMVQGYNKKQKRNRFSFSRRNVRVHGTNLIFMLPAIIIYFIIVLIPFFQGIPYSFTNWKSIISDNMSFVGLKNFKTLLTN